MRTMSKKILVYLRDFAARYPRLRVAVGILLIILGLAALFTPLTPGSWLALIGLELLGFGVLLKKKAIDS